MECTKHYSPRDRTIRDSERNILADFSPASISEAFGIPSHQRMVTKKQEQAQRIYTSGINFCEEIINKRWLKKNRPHHSKIPKEIVWLDLQREYSDMVMMLSRIFGMPYSYRFESWMWYFVEQVMEEADIIDWARLISDNLNEQLMNLEHTRKFYMSSYVIYMLARRTHYDGL